MSGDKLCHRWVTDQVTSLRNACWLKFSDSYKTTCFTMISITSGATNSRVISKTLSMHRILWATTKVNFDSRILISRALCFLKFLIIQTKPTFPSPVKHCNFTHVFQTSWLFKLICFSQGGLKNQNSTVVKSGLHSNAARRPQNGNLLVRRLFHVSLGLGIG